MKHECVSGLGVRVRERVRDSAIFEKGGCSLANPNPSPKAFANPKLSNFTMGLIPQIADIVDFNEDPESYGDLPPEIRGTDLKLNFVRITENYHAHYPYPTVKATNSDALSNGIKIDIQHFRKMVAKLIQVSFRDYPYIEFSNILLHPLFYSSIERLNFILLADEYMKEYTYSEVGLAGFSNREYGFVNWWTHIPPTSICQDILHFEDNFNMMYYRRPYNLILFLRKCHTHLIRKKKATHLEADSMLHQLFPDVCAVAIDAIARAIGMEDLMSNKSQYTLMEYFFVSTFGFNIIPYRYFGVH
ncbi:hypothetical protein SO802_019655 [Lithocarpus litseifolius]|uniref:NR LBD domain-containing protein n=1 Tax=Lithocarpus litseifolius TaxID=425828 RepID=A0AAW2CRK6_9ROSI